MNKEEKYFKLDKDKDKDNEEFSSIYEERSISNDIEAKTKYTDLEFDKMVFDKYFFIGLFQGIFFNILSLFCYVMNHKKSYRYGVIMGLLLSFLVIAFLAFLFYVDFKK